VTGAVEKARVAAGLAETDDRGIVIRTIQANRRDYRRTHALDYGQTGRMNSMMRPESLL